MYRKTTKFPEEVSIYTKTWSHVGHLKWLLSFPAPLSEALLRDQRPPSRDSESLQGREGKIANPSMSMVMAEGSCRCFPVRLPCSSHIPGGLEDPGLPEDLPVSSCFEF